MNFFLKKWLFKTFAKESLQKYNKKIYLLGLAGMGYGSASLLEIDESGEEKVFDYFIKKQSGNANELTIFDVGANMGHFSIIFSKKLQKLKSIFFCFEPSNFTYNELIKNTKEYSNIKVFNIGLGSKEETLSLHTNFDGTGSATIYQQGLQGFSKNPQTETISLTTLDKFCADSNIKKIDYLKIDVEGHELEVLKGGEQFLKNYTINFIQFEFGHFHIYSRTFFKDFWDLLSPDYNIYRILPSGIYPINHYGEDLEIFKACNFLAIKK